MVLPYWTFWYCIYTDYFIINSFNDIYFLQLKFIVFTYLLLYIYKLSEMLKCYID